MLRRRPAGVAIGAWFGARGDEDDKGVACVAGADLHPDVAKSDASQKPLERGVREAEALVAKAGTHPLLVVLAQIQDDQAAARAQNAQRLGQRLLGIGGMVQRLGKERDVDRLVVQWETCEVAFAPLDVDRVAAAGQVPRPFQHLIRPIDAVDRARPPCEFERQITVSAPEVGDVDFGKQVAERSRPGRPAPARDELAHVTVGLEVLFPVASNFLEPGFVRAYRRVIGRRHEVSLEQRPQGRLPAAPALVRYPVVDVAPLALLADEARLLQ